MKTRFSLFGFIAIFLLGIGLYFASCNNNDLNGVVTYKGHVVYVKTSTPFPDLEVKVTNGDKIHTQTHTDAEGAFSLKVKVSEIDGSYYVLVGDTTCVTKKVDMAGYGQAEVDLGTIEIEGPTVPVVITKPVVSVTADAAVCSGEVTSDGRLNITARGVCYSKNAYPTITDDCTKDGNGVGEFTSNLSNLEHNTIYYVRAYATNRMGVAYGEQVKFTTEEGVPIVVTDSVIRITAHSARCKGHVESDGGYPVTKRGTCWSKQPDPTIDDNCTNDGSGLGEFTSALTDLIENTTYYIRTYATNSTSTVYGEQIVITTLDGLAVVKTDSIINITATGCTAYGTVVSDCDIPVTARGFCYSTMQYPTIEDNHTTTGKGLGQFQSNITNLEVGTTYYVRAYATNATETTYGEQIEIQTKSGLASVVTKQGSATATSITIAGQVTDNGGFAVTERGICYSATNSEPTTTDAKIIGGQGNGTYNVTISELTAATTYYLRAYATNANGTAYGTVVSLTTSNGQATVNTGQIFSIAALSASGKVTVTNAGGATLQTCGICYGTMPNPTITDNTVVGGNQLNIAYTCNMTNLTPNTTYYVRGYATTNITTTYGIQATFTTESGLPLVITTEPIATSTYISAGGDITSDGGYSITARGLCYSTTTSTPTLSDQFTTAGVGIGVFSSVISGVSASTTYYVRAYATNSIGTGYGDAIAVTTGNGLPVVITTAPTLTDSTVSSGGQIIGDEGYPITARGICYGPLPNPDLTSTYMHTTDGNGTGYYASTFFLVPGSGRFYIRAYATNANGTTYGEQYSVIHPYDVLPTFTYNGNTYRVAPGPHTRVDEYVTWSAANSYCENLTAYGYSDWRLPTLEELQAMYQSRTYIGGWLGSYTSTNGTQCYSVYWSSETAPRDIPTSGYGSCYPHYVVKWNNGTTFAACDLDSDGKWWHEVTPHYYYISHVRPIRVEE